MQREVAVAVAGGNELGHAVAETLALLNLHATCSAPCRVEGDLQLLNLGMKCGALLVG